MIVRELFTKMGLLTDGKSFELGGSLVERMKRKLGDLGEAVLEAVEQFQELVQSQAESGKQLHETAQITGLATDELQRLDKAAVMSGVSADTLHHGLLILSRTMAAAKEGGEEQGKAFAKMGVKYKEANGHLRSAGDVLGDLADHFASMPDGAEKTAAAMKVLGRSGAELIPLLNQGGKAIEEIGATATIMSEEQIAASEHLILTQKKLAAVNASTGKKIANGLIPAIDRLTERYYNWRKASVAAMQPEIEWLVEKLTKGIDWLGRAFTWATQHAQKFAVIIGAGGALFLAGIGLIGLFKAIASGAMWAGIKTAAAWVIAAAPLILLAAFLVAVALAIEDVWVAAEGGKSVFGDLWPEWAKALVSWKKGTSDFWNDLAEGWKEIFRDFFNWIGDGVQNATARAYNATIGKVGGGHMNTVKEQADVNWADKQLYARELGAPGSARNMAAMGYQYHPTAAPMTAAPGGGATVVNHIKKHVTIHADKHTAHELHAMVKEHLSTVMEDANAASAD